jgi:hypothetical protein
VTGGYLKLTPERLRELTQQAEDRLLQLAKVRRGGTRRASIRAPVKHRFVTLRVTSVASGIVASAMQELCQFADTLTGAGAATEQLVSRPAGVP